MVGTHGNFMIRPAGVPPMRFFFQHELGSRRPCRNYRRGARLREKIHPILWSPGEGAQNECEHRTRAPWPANHYRRVLRTNRHKTLTRWRACRRPRRSRGHRRQLRPRAGARTATTADRRDEWRAERPSCATGTTSRRNAARLFRRSSAVTPSYSAIRLRIVSRLYEASAPGKPAMIVCSRSSLRASDIESKRARAALARSSE
jgi:hypothetical protein